MLCLERGVSSYFAWRQHLLHNYKMEPKVRLVLKLSCPADLRPMIGGDEITTECHISDVTRCR